MSVSEEKKDELKQHSIFILPDDKDTDYEFYLLVGDDKSDNEFLKELFNFLNTSNNKFADYKHKEELKKWLGITNDAYLTPLNWLKIAIERYPYRLFVAVDNPDEYKNNASKSKFLKQRICWIKKDELKDAFLKENDFNLFEVKKLEKNKNGKCIPVGNNLLKDFKPYQRGILWLYYKWIGHIMEITEKKEKLINIYVEIDERSDYFIPVTSPFKEQSNSIDNYSVNNKIFYGIGVMNFTKNHPNSPQICLSRHEPLATSTCKDFLSAKFLYSQGYSGSQFQYNIIIPSTDDFNQFYKTMLFVENALFKKLIFDERFQNFYTSQTKDVKQKLICSGLFPVKEIRTKVKTIFNFDKGEGITLNKKNNGFEIEKGDIKTIMGKFHPEIYNGNYLYLLIIHQGILDKIKENPRKLILDLKDSFPFIQITSGRGKPENVPKCEKFIEFSNIEQVMKEFPEDLILTKIAFKVIAKEE